MKNHQNFEAKKNDKIFAIINLLSLLQMIALVKYFLPYVLTMEVFKKSTRMLNPFAPFI